MAQLLTDSLYIKALKDSGLKRGDIVLVQSSLAAIGPIEPATSDDDILNFYLNGLNEVLGPEGTLCVYTSFEDYGRFGTPFVLEESPSRSGVFSEFIRKLPGAVRSIHPINSVTSIGKHAQDISGGPHFEGFGWDSPWGRLHRAEGKVLSLGIPFVRSMTLIHYIEAMYGVPYKYTKIYNYPVMSKGRKVEGVFTNHVRFLDYGIEFTVERFQDELLKKGLAREVPIGRGKIHIASIPEAFNLGMECLRRDRYFFLKNPPKFRDGEIPMDGGTGKMQSSYDRSPSKG